jgi:hypothetical protein
MFIYFSGFLFFSTQMFNFFFFATFTIEYLKSERWTNKIVFCNFQRPKKLSKNSKGLIKLLLTNRRNFKPIMTENKTLEVLNKHFKIYFYDGGVNPSSQDSTIDKILLLNNDFHSSDPSLGLNRSLILEYNGPKKFFTLESLKIDA